MNRKHINTDNSRSPYYAVRAKNWKGTIHALSMRIPTPQHTPKVGRYSNYPLQGCVSRAIDRLRQAGMGDTPVCQRLLEADWNQVVHAVDLDLWTVRHALAFGAPTRTKLMGKAIEACNKGWKCQQVGG